MITDILKSIYKNASKSFFIGRTGKTDVNEGELQHSQSNTLYENIIIQILMNRECGRIIPSGDEQFGFVKKTGTND